jgi:putative hydrolase of the HAD superfamily
MKRHFLIIDADDTLWENNIYFERAFDDFVAYLDHSRLTPREVRDVLDAIESVNAKIHGYGSLNFGRNLRETYERLCERHIGPDDIRTVMGFAERILECPMEVLEGVEETLELLACHHELTLFTKGNPEEQRLKIDRSGLGKYFSHTAIVREKNRDAYRKLAGERGMEPEITWMIGNSPKSDINPALDAGLNAVFVPHAHTWVLEREEIRPRAGKLLVLEKFSELQTHFGPE